MTTNLMEARIAGGDGAVDSCRHAAVPCERVTFPSHGAFRHRLVARVKDHFEGNGLSIGDQPAMYAKTCVILLWLATSYALLLAWAGTWWLAVPLACALGLALAAVGFNIQHDGGHRSYSRHGWVNKLMALSLDLLGGSSYVWAHKHNSVHHTYCNITDHDDDINIGVLGRLSPHQKHYRAHRLQHVYLWLLYGLLPIKWQLYDDFRDVALGRIGRHAMKRPRGTELLIFVVGKLAFFTLAFVVPMRWHGVGVALLYYFIASFVQGLVLSVVFQLAHCVEEADFPMPEPESGKMTDSWMTHQVQTTVNFARGNKPLTWLVGGLNYQIEHHLFPGICHVHYPALAEIVRETCREFGIVYREHRTLGAGVASHYRWLRRLGRLERGAEDSKIP